MKRTLIQIAAFALLAGAVAFTPSRLQAQESTATNAPAAPKPEKKKHEAGPFRGKVAAIDATAKTITIGKTTYEITSETKIFKANKPATLGDLAVGDEARGRYHLVGEKKVAIRIFSGVGPAGTGPEETK